MAPNFLLIDAEKEFDVLKAAASLIRVQILKLLHEANGLNVNEIAQRLDLPQSTVSAGVTVLEEAGLLRTETRKARKGSQKICFATCDELIVSFRSPETPAVSNYIAVAMPLGLYTQSSVTAPCGICSPEGIIGLLDVPDTFMDPDRMKTALLGSHRVMLSTNSPIMPRYRGETSRKSSFRWRSVPRCQERTATGRQTLPSPSTARRSGSDLARGFRRQARYVYARLVETVRLAVWNA